MKFALRELMLAAGKRERVNEVASFFMLVSNTGTKRVKIAIDDDPFSECPIGYEYREPEGSFFKHIDFKNPNASEITIEYIVSTGLVRSAPVITALEDILAELQGPQQGTDWDEKTVGLTQGVIVGIDSARTAINIQAKSTNTGKIYLGFNTSVTTIRWFAELQPGQACMLDDYRGAIYAVSDTAGQKLGVGKW